MKDVEITAMQKFLATKKIPVPVTGIMDKATISAYQSYRASLGVPYPANTYLPATRNDLPRDMKLYVDMYLDEEDSQQENSNSSNTELENTNQDNQNNDGTTNEDDTGQQQDLDEENNDDNDNDNESEDEEETQPQTNTTTEVKTTDTKSDGIISKLSSFVKK